MRIGIVAFPHDKGHSGAWEYISNIVTSLEKADTENHYFVFTPHDFKFSNPNFTQILLRGAWINNQALNILWHQLYLPYAVMKFKIDVLHHLGGNRRGLLWKPCKVVLTINDLWQFHISGKYGRLRFFGIISLLPAYLRNVSRIIAISEATKKDIVKFLSFPASLIHIIPVGVEDIFEKAGAEPGNTQGALERYGLSGKYIFCVSRLEHPAKNHVALIEAFEALRRKTPIPYKLVLAGPDWNGAEVIKERARKSGFAADIVFTGHIPREDLPYLYKGADLFVFPSLFEGFGIPVVEAMASGTPVICSNTSSLPEVLGGCGLMFDPGNPAEIASCMNEMLTQPELRSFFVAKGLERAKCFGWEQIAVRTVEIYRSVGRGETA